MQDFLGHKGSLFPVVVQCCMPSDRSGSSCAKFPICTKVVTAMLAHIKVRSHGTETLGSFLSLIKIVEGQLQRVHVRVLFQLFQMNGSNCIHLMFGTYALLGSGRHEKYLKQPYLVAVSNIVCITLSHASSYIGVQFGGSIECSVSLLDRFHVFHLAVASSPL